MKQIFAVEQSTTEYYVIGCYIAKNKTFFIQPSHTYWETYYV